MGFVKSGFSHKAHEGFRHVSLGVQKGYQERKGRGPSHCEQIYTFKGFRRRYESSGGYIPDLRNSTGQITDGIGPGEPSSELPNIRTYRVPPNNGATIGIHIFDHEPPPWVAWITVAPIPTAGLNAPPEIGPPAIAATTIVKPIANP